MLIDSDITDIDDRFEKRTLHDANLFYPDFFLASKDNHQQTATNSLINNPSTSEISYNTEHEYQQLQTTHETY